MRLRLAAIMALGIFIMPQAANAIEQGEPVKEPTRAVAIYAISKQNTMIQVCSGFLFSSNIVFTAAHCIQNPIFKDNAILVGQPGRKTFTGKIIPANKIYIHPQYVQVNHDSDLGAINDFAIIKTKQQVAKVSPAKLINEVGMANLRDSFSEVSVVGYGFTSQKDRHTRNFAETKIMPKIARFKLTTKLDASLAIDYVMNKYSREYHPENLEYLIVNNNGPSLCDGDSGSGYFHRNTFLGIANWTINGTNCDGPVDPNIRSFGSFDPVYKFRDFIKTSIGVDF